MHAAPARVLFFYTLDISFGAARAAPESRIKKKSHPDREKESGAVDK
jgi:hypothetical protein